MSSGPRPERASAGPASHTTSGSRNFYGAVAMGDPSWHGHLAFGMAFVEHTDSRQQAVLWSMFMTMDHTLKFSVTRQILDARRYGSFGQRLSDWAEIITRIRA